jgi:hypothetical protein
MKKSPTKDSRRKLALRREAIALLTPEQLGNNAVRGGSDTDYTQTPKLDVIG